MLLKDGYRDIRRRNVHNAQAILGEAMSKVPDVEARRLFYATNTGTWLSLSPYTVNGEVLGSQE